MSAVLQDLRHGIRLLFRNPGFTTAAVITLALGIGAATAIASIFDAVLLRSLPFDRPEGLVMLWGVDREQGWEFATFSTTEYTVLRDEFRALEGVGGFEAFDFNLSGPDGPERIAGARADGSLFGLLGARPALGRTFTSAEGARDEKLALLSHALWQRRFGADPAVIGRAITLHAASSLGAPPGVPAPANLYTIVGVLPAGFRLPTVEADVWVPLPLGVAGATGSLSPLQVIGRTRPGVPSETALAEFGALHARVRQTHPELTSESVRFVPLRDHDVGDLRPTIFLLLAAVGFILLIACANVAGLLLERASGRSGEMAIRSALGAGRRRLILQLLTESSVLALLGGGVGVALAFWGLPLLVRLSPGEVLRSRAVGLNLFALGVACVVSVLTGLVFGLAPALRASRTDLSRSLKRSGTARVGSRERGMLRRLLVVSEVALAVVLLIGAGLIARSFWRLSGVDPGFDPGHVLTARIALSHDRHPGGPQREEFFRRLLERVRMLPGVRAAGVTTILPLTSSDAGVFFTVEGRPTPDPTAVPTASVRLVSPGYLEAMGIPVVHGRAFDADSTRLELMISEEMARQFWPNEDPVGRRIKLNRPEMEGPWLPVVGITQDVRHSGPTEAARPTLYVPRLGQPAMTLAVRTAGEPLTLAAALRTAVMAVDPEQPVHDVLTLEQRLSLAIAPERFRTMLVVLFAAVALVLAAIGLYAVLSAAAARRAHEIGIRMALGAGRWAVIRLVLRQGMGLILAGLGAGLAGGLVMARLLAALLFEIKAIDPLTFVAAPVLLAAVALLACWVPAHRATRVDPCEALRAE